MATQFTDGVFHADDDNGLPLVGGLLYTYSAGTTTNKTTYSDPGLSVPNANPVVLNARGEADVWWGTGSIRMTLKTAAGVTIWDKDNIPVTQGLSWTAFAQTILDAANATEVLDILGIDYLVTPQMHDAVGDGSTDDTAAISATFAAADGKRVDGGGLTYRITQPITVTTDNMIVENMTIDASDVPDQGGSPDRIITFAGTQGTATALSADATANSTYQLTVASTTGFSADGYAWLYSSKVWEDSTSVTLGQIVKVKSVDSATALTLYDEVLYDFATSDTASIAPLTMKSNITFRNVKFIGAGTFNQSMLDFDKCQDVLVENCTFDDVDYLSIRFSRCVNAKASKCTIRNATASGLAYGIVPANGCYDVTISECHAEDVRHLVSVGDDEGINLYVKVFGNHILGSKDAGIDAHTACDLMTITGNTIHCAAVKSGNADGIIFQGLNCVISDNIIVGAARNSIFAQIIPDMGVGSVTITGNTIRSAGGDATTEAAINVLAQPGAGGSSINGVTISGNTIDGAADIHIQVYAVSGNIKSVAVTGNVSTTNAASRSILIRAATGYTLEDFTVSGNVCRSAGAEGIFLLGGTSANVINGVVSGNTIKGTPTYGVRFTAADSVDAVDNRVSGATLKYGVDTVSTALWLDNKASTPTTVAAVSYVVTPMDRMIMVAHSATCTLTLPTASIYPGRELFIKTTNAQAVDSASSNVVPVGGTSTTGTAILPATDGAWAMLKSDGTAWITMQEG